jgi:hypothetical protein
MAMFISVTIGDPDDTILINMDAVLKIQPAKNHTALIFCDANHNVTVRETPSEIMDLIRHEQRIR